MDCLRKFEAFADENAELQAYYRAGLRFSHLEAGGRSDDPEELGMGAMERIDRYYTQHLLPLRIASRKVILKWMGLSDG